nr:hypothetical protein [Mucilaginibacter sp. L294]
MKIYTAFALVCLLGACHNKKNSRSADKDTIKAKPVKQSEKSATLLHTDTLQFIHFEGNFDYWYGVFLDARKDTVQLVVNDAVPAKLKNKLVEVKWFTDSLSEAGDNGTKYAAKRLKVIRQVNGALFSAPVTEEKVVGDVKDLPEIKANADQTGIAERPTDEKEYYLVETGTRGEDNFSRLFMFRVYVYPKYEIKFYDPAGDTEMSLDEWRNKKQ